MEGIGKGWGAEPVFCRLSIVFMHVMIWDWCCTLTSERCSYGSMLVWWRRDMIPSVVGPDIGVVGEDSRAR